MDPSETPEPYADAARKRTGIRGRAEWYEHASAASIGIEMAVAITLGAVSGMWIEARFTHWSPWTTLIGLMFGIAAAALAIVRTIREDDERRKAKAAKTSQEPGQTQAGEDLDPSESPLTPQAAGSDLSQDPLTQVLAGGPRARSRELELTSTPSGADLELADGSAPRSPTEAASRNARA